MNPREPISTGGDGRFSHPLRELILARFREFLREPAAIFWVYGFPLIMVITLGVAFRNRPAEQIAVDVQRGARSAAVAETLSADPRFRVTESDPSAAEVRLRTGRSDLVVVPLADEGVRYEYRFDPTRPGNEAARFAVDDALQRAVGRNDLFTARDREVMEPGGRYIDFLVPGLIGMGLMGGGLWGVGFALVDMRIRKLLKRFAATPMKRLHFMGALMISRLAFTVPEVLVILLISRWLFDVTNHGNLVDVVVLIVLGAVQFSGIGLLLASRAQKLETASGLMNLVMMPMWIGSGIFFSTERFPGVIQPVIQALPLTPLINSLRAVINEGAGLASMTGEMGILCAWTVVTVVLALRLFRWT